MKYWLLPLLTLLTFQVFAQDTTIVQTLTYDDITKRRDIYVFPDESHQYRKVLMLYNLKCDPATTQDGFNCGEWDYLTYTNVYDHTGNLDSNAQTHPKYIVKGTSPSIIDWVTNPVYDVYQGNQTVVDNIIVNSEMGYFISQGNEAMSLPLGTTSQARRSQFIWRVDELIAAGFQAGNYERMAILLNDAGEAIQHLTIRMKNTNTDEADVSFENTGLTTVYQQHTNFTNPGIQVLDFINPFSWDGTSNILIDISYKNPQPGSSDHVLSANNAQFTSGLISDDGNGVLDFENGVHVSIPVDDFSEVNNEVTIAFWCFGDPNILPADTYLCEGQDADNRRQLNVHLPWSNGSVYWDAGDDGSGYDRIFKQANPQDYKGRWNHWAFTKDAVAGEMKIFLNGQLWHSGTGLTKPMSNIDKFTIGDRGQLNGGRYYGSVDEFQVWNVALDENTIRSWMFRRVDNQHPNFANLKYYYRFDEEGTTAHNSVNTNLPAALIGTPQRRYVHGRELFQISSQTNLRPNITLYQGDYDITTTTLPIIEQQLRAPKTLITYEVQGNFATPIDTSYGYLEGNSWVYDENGNVIDSMFISSTDTFTNDTLHYFSPPYEVIDRYEIGRFITPYGIGLDLGPDGWTWVYDVTDYQHLLHDSVDFSAGNQQELIDVKFMMIEGTPPREVLQLDRVWGARRSYSYRALDNDEVLTETTIDKHPDAVGIKLRARLTGHGHNSNSGAYPHCCEWKNNTHYIYLDGTPIDAFNIWQTHDCALNPVYPQGGTWPGSREGWCPGDKVKNYDVELGDLIFGDQFTLDYDITDVPPNNQGMGNGNYQVAMHLFQYGDYNFTRDVEITDILAPSAHKRHSRDNPICFAPKIRIRNVGSSSVSRILIEYGVVGGQSTTYLYNQGAIYFNESRDVELPVNDFSFWNGGGTFFARILEVNDAVDDYNENDYATSPFEMPVHFDFERVVLQVRSNNRGSENSYSLKDMSGNTLVAYGSLTSNFTYIDTIDFGPGCYTFSMIDNGNDGLSYWADPGAGNGSVSIKHPAGPTLQGFESEFGRSLFFTFTIGDIVDVKSSPFEPTVSVFPNPNGGKFRINIHDYFGAAKIEVFDGLGRDVWSEEYLIDNQVTIPVNLYNQPDGLYFIKVSNEGHYIVKKLSINK